MPGAVIGKVPAPRVLVIANADGLPVAGSNAVGDTVANPSFVPESVVSWIGVPFTNDPRAQRLHHKGSGVGRGNPVGTVLIGPVIFPLASTVSAAPSVKLVVAPMKTKLRIAEGLVGSAMNRTPRGWAA